MTDIKLKNGALEDINVINVTMMAIEKLFHKNTDDVMVLGLTDVLMGFDDSNYKASQEMYAYLSEAGLAKKNASTQQYEIHSITKNVLQSCFMRDGFAVTKMISPIEGDEKINYSFNRKFEL